MISFATEFPVGGCIAIEDFVRLAHKWIAGSPHSSLRLEDLPTSIDEFERMVSTGREAVVTAALVTETDVLGGVKYSIADADGIQWTTTVVANSEFTQTLVSIQVFCENEGAALVMPSAKKPYIVRQLLSEFGGGMDGEVPVADKPIRLDENQVLAAAALLQGRAGNRLPIVYVSTGFDGKPVFDPIQLTKWLSGSAHVIVEPTRLFSRQLRDLVGSSNAFGGSVGVYWPNGGMIKRYHARDQKAAKFVVPEIAADIRTSLANRRLSSSVSWVSLKECIAARRIDLLKQNNSSRVEDYVDAFDAEIAAKTLRIDELERENAALLGEKARLVGMASQRSGGLLDRGKEQDFFAGEIKDVVVDAMRAKLASELPESRRYHILSDLVEHNPRLVTAEDLARQIKDALRGYSSMDHKTRGVLEASGFVLTEDGKHFKAVYQGDGRYTFSIAKSGSEHRGGLNLASDITKRVY